MELENIYGVIYQCMTDSGVKIKSMEEEFTYGLMEEDLKANG